MTPRALLLFVVGLSVAAALTRNAVADPAGRARRDAHAAFVRGEAAAAAGRYDDALVAYEQAYALVPAPALLFDIAQAHRALGHHHAAADALRAYLRTRTGDPQHAQGRAGEVCVSRACIEALIAELEDAAPGSVAPSRIAEHAGLAPPRFDDPPRHADPTGGLDGGRRGPGGLDLQGVPPRRASRRRWWIAAGAAVVSASAAAWWLTRDRDPCGGVALCVR